MRQACQMADPSRQRSLRGHPGMACCRKSLGSEEPWHGLSGGRLTLVQGTTCSFSARKSISGKNLLTSW